MYGRNSSREELLFNKGDWFRVSAAQKQRMDQDIATKNGDQLLNTSTEDLAKYYSEEFAIDVPMLDMDNVTVGQREAKIDVSHDRFRYFSDNSGPHYITGTAVDVEVTFSGDEGVFNVQPTTHTMNPPRAYISNGVLHFSIQGTDLTAQKVQGEIGSRLDSIEQYLGWLRQTATPFNASLLDQARSQIEARKKKLLADRNLVAGLGFKMRERPEAAKTYAAPNVRRKISPRPPSASSAPYKPEPVLEDAEYNHILGVLENMVKVMEQSPGAFSKMDEESLRTHFLVQLNGHYEGGATGETFNFEGKTDILVKVNGRNIFVGECKFWKGEKSYLETIDQLLRYTSWRDTKASILVFNRNKDFSAVLEKIQETTLTHPNYKKLVAKCSETSWRYLFSQPEDANREMTVTVQAYNVPEHIEPRIGTL
ncbi:hypothetical protein [Albirhodobacter sp. R86504]|uniref:hypothetical protein n=1 Tax=Albirhodobacter sp. R86504 TaxID=3093848 RepID=UPI00366EEE11